MLKNKLFVQHLYTFIFIFRQLDIFFNLLYNSSIVPKISSFGESVPRIFKKI